MLEYLEFWVKQLQVLFVYLHFIEFFKDKRPITINDKRILRAEIRTILL